MKKVLLAAFFLLTTALFGVQGAQAQATEGKDVKRVEIVTTKGKIVVALYNETPQHRDNFLKLVNNGTYNGLLFHRVIKDFMMQGGDPDSRNAKQGQPLGSGTVGYTVPAEFHPMLFHKKGALCAARQGDAVNPKRESSGSQFYIVQGRLWNDSELDQIANRYHKTFSKEQRELYKTVGGTPFLDGDYTVFGEVVSGLEVVDRICYVPTDRSDRPVDDVKIISMRVLK